MTAQPQPAAPGNLPPPGQTYLDHIGHFVADADTCSQALREAGFAVTPFSAQTAPDPATGQPGPTGTGNVCVMLGAGYLEFLVHTADTPIGLEFRAALTRRAGVHLAAFAVADAEARHAALAGAGLPMRPLVRMERQIDSPQGPLTARFTVARLERGTMPEGRVQMLTHGTEAALWQPRWMSHPNGAAGLSAVMVSAPDPAEAAARFAAFLGRPAEPRAAGGRRGPPRPGAGEFWDEEAALALTGQAVEPGRPAFFAYRLAMTDIDRARACMEAAGLTVRAVPGGLLCPFPPALGLGCWLLSAA